MFSVVFSLLPKNCSINLLFWLGILLFKFFLDLTSKLVKDSLEFNSKKLIVSTNDIINTSGLVLGNTVIQKNGNARADYVGAGGSATGDLSIVNAGIG